MSTLFTPLQGWATLAVFGAASFALATLALRHRRQSKEEFLVASRRVTWRSAGFSIAATWIWAPALFVASLQAYQHGWVGVFWFTVPNVACLVLFAWFAQRARAMFPRGFTASDMARQGYSPRVQRLYLFAFAGLAVCSFAVQLLAGGLVVSALTGIPFALITLALAGIVLAYSIRSGLAASIITDYAQMVVIGLVGVGLAVAVAVRAGWDTIAAGVNGIGGDYTSLTSGPGAALFWSFGLSTSIGLLSGPFGDQTFWQRAWAVREGDVKRSFLLGAGIFALVPISMSLLGFAAAGAGLKPEDPQLTNLEAILAWLPEWTVVLFLLYVFAGLTSTLDSHLAAISSLVGHDLTRDESRVIARGRVAMIALAILGLAIANLPGIAIVQLFIFYGTLRACTLVPTMLMLAWRRTVSERGAFVGILSALLVGIPMSAYGNLTKDVPWVVAGSLAVIALSGLGVVIGTLVEERRDGIGGPQRPLDDRVLADA